MVRDFSLGVYAGKKNSAQSVHVSLRSCLLLRYMCVCVQKVYKFYTQNVITTFSRLFFRHFRSYINFKNVLYHVACWTGTLRKLAAKKKKKSPDRRHPCVSRDYIIMLSFCWCFMFLRDFYTFFFFSSIGTWRVDIRSIEKYIVYNGIGRAH